LHAQAAMGREFVLLREQNLKKKMHREVPPLVMGGCLFSMRYVCRRSIDRSAP